MINKEVFEKYATEQWVIEENLVFLLQEFMDEIGIKYGEIPINLVSFIKKFMKEETLVDEEFAEKSLQDTINKKLNKLDIIDAEYIEIKTQGISN